MMEWKFSDPPNVAVFTHRKIVDRTSLIVHVSHDQSDGAWQFLPTDAPDASNAALVINPVTREEIKITRPAAAAEILVDGNWRNFLWWRDGELFTKYHSDFDNPFNPIRQRIAAIALHFSSKIMTDIDDGPLDW